MNPRHYNQIERAITILDKSHITAAFSHDKNLLFQFKKTERIVVALYLLTSFLSDNEPIRYKTREIGTGLMHEILSLMISSQDAKKTREISTLIFRLVSLIDLAHISGLFSLVHHSALKEELMTLLEHIEKRGSNALSPLGNLPIPPSFFQSPPPSDHHKGHLMSLKDVLYGGKERLKTSVPEGSEADSADISRKRHFSRSRAIQEGRRSKIVAILKERGSISVKDISEIIRDCSPKSIQRILSDLVQSGLLKTEGEKRWTRYLILKEGQKDTPTSPI